MRDHLGLYWAWLEAPVSHKATTEEELAPHLSRAPNIRGPGPCRGVCKNDTFKFGLGKWLLWNLKFWEEETDTPV